MLDLLTNLFLFLDTVRPYANKSAKILLPLSVRKRSACTVSPRWVHLLNCCHCGCTLFTSWEQIDVRNNFFICYLQEAVWEIANEHRLVIQLFG